MYHYLDGIGFLFPIWTNLVIFVYLEMENLVYFSIKKLLVPVH